MSLDEKEIYMHRKMVMAKYTGKKIKYLYYKLKYERIKRKNGI